MEMTPQKLQLLIHDYRNLLVMDDDIVDALDFVSDLCDAEADAIEQNEPHAVKSVFDLRSAAHEIRMLGYDILAKLNQKED